MKNLSPALQAHLDDGATTLSWCWQITRSDSVALGFTDHDRALSFDGTAFEPESGFAASEIRAGFEFDVPVRFDSDSLDVTLDFERLGSITAIPLLEIRR